MKIPRFTILAALLASPAFAQTNTFPSTGNVGIGTTNPDSLLHLNSGGSLPGLHINASGNAGTPTIIYENSWVTGTKWLTAIDSNDGVFLGTKAVGASQYAFAVTSSGNIGIGTTLPGTYRLSVRNDSGPGIQSRAAYSDAVGERKNYVLNAGSGDWWGLGIANSGAFSLDFLDPNGGGANKFNVLSVTSAGTIGAGPNAHAHNSSCALSVKGHLAVGTTNSHIIMGEGAADSTSGGYIYLRSTGHLGRDFNILNYSNAEGWRTNFVVTGESGNVGIGTTSPQHKLAVNGTIKAKEVIVETTGWSDYVFADDHTLQPLSQVEAHIKEHKHLPGIPSASAVASNGVNVGDMQAALLAKVEELTLHLIAQQKELARLREIEKDIATLRAEVRQLRQTK